MPVIDGKSKSAATWMVKKIRIVCEFPSGATAPGEVIDAVVLGPLAVFCGKMPKDRWRVSHVPSGRRVIWMNCEQEAKRVAEILWRESPAVWRLQEKDEVKAAMPPWQRPWLEECERLGKCVPVDEFKKAHRSR